MLSAVYFVCFSLPYPKAYTLLIFYNLNELLFRSFAKASTMQPEADTGGRGLFLQPLVFFCNHFEELQTALFELIINNKPLTYLYPNTIETCFTFSHLLFGTQLLYSSKTT